MDSMRASLLITNGTDILELCTWHKCRPTAHKRKGTTGNAELVQYRDHFLQGCVGYLISLHELQNECLAFGML